MVASRVGIPHVGQPVIGSAGTGGFATQDPHGAFQVHSQFFRGLTNNQQTSGTMHAPEGLQPEQKEMAQPRETSGESAPRMPTGER